MKKNTKKNTDAKKRAVVKKMQKKSIVKRVKEMQAKRWPTLSDKVECSMILTAVLKIDHRYQRGEHKAYVKRLKKSFDTNKFGFPIISQRKNGRYYIIDGQQRIAAAIQLGYTTIPVIVMQGLTPRQETIIFIAFNTNKKVTPLERFKARLFRQESVATKLNKIVKQHGYQVLSAKGGKSINCISTLEKIFRKYGAQHLSETLSFLIRTWKDDSDALTEPMVKGAAIFLDNPNVKRFDFNRAILKFRRMPAISVLNTGEKLRFKMGSSGHIRGKAQAQAFQDLYEKKS